MKQNLLASRLMASAILLFLGCVSLWGQNSGRKTVEGTVVDASSGEPVIGAYISLDSSSKYGAMTDFDGSFVLEVPSTTSGRATFTIECVGFEDKTLTLSEIQASSKILLDISVELLEEVVVVGYGTQKKASSVGSITQTSGAEIQRAGNMNSVSEALQGKLNGVVLFNSTGQPGDNAAQIYIRGKSSWQSSLLFADIAR